jgi:His/Glu/Gln/Arg/opine family amino acid ABC transporter permease subunit
VGGLLSEFNVLGAFWVTIQLAALTAVCSLLLGTVLAVMRVSPVASLRVFGAGYVNIFRNTPLTLIIVGANLGLYVQRSTRIFDWPYSAFRSTTPPSSVRLSAAVSTRFRPARSRRPGPSD